MAKIEKAADPAAAPPAAASPSAGATAGPKAVAAAPVAAEPAIVTPSGYRVLIAGALRWRRGEVIPAGAIDSDTLVRLYGLAAVSPVFDVSPGELERAPETMPGRGGSDAEIPWAVPAPPPEPGPVQPPPPPPPAINR